MMVTMSEPGPGWTVFSNHAHVLVCLADNPLARFRDIADRVGVTERTAVRVVRDLEEVEMLTRVKEGRRNRYVINTHAHLRHPLESHCTVGELLATILGERASSSDAAAGGNEAPDRDNPGERQ